MASESPMLMSSGCCKCCSEDDHGKNDTPTQTPKKSQNCSTDLCK